MKNLAQLMVEHYLRLMGIDQTRPATGLSKLSTNATWLWVEFLALFVIAPSLLATVLDPSQMFPALFGVTALGIALLWFTPDFRWRTLFEGVSSLNWSFVFVFSVATAITCYVVITATRPDALFFLFSNEAPRLSNGWPIIIMIALFYPIVSALPQELVFRPLFFRRYEPILPEGFAAIVLNAGLFSLAHLMYWSWIVAAMTFFGGLAFAISYERRNNFAEAVILHSIAGVIVFAFGLGVYFYSGNVVRPF